MERHTDCLIVGAGASGLFAACLAEEAGLSYLIVDRNAEPGKKLLLTGGGRANFAHAFTVSMERLQDVYHSKAAARFLCPALRNLDSRALRGQFRRWGLESKLDEEGRIYPASERAQDLRDCLWRRLKPERLWLQTELQDLDLGCPRVTEEAYLRALLVPVGRGAQARQGEWLRARTSLLAGGGAHFRMTGSDGSLLALLAEKGLAVEATGPALAALGGGVNPFASLTGLGLEEAEIQLRLGSRPGEKSASGAQNLRLRGPLLFTHRGLSGPLALDVSRYYPWKEARLNVWLEAQGRTEESFLRRLLAEPQRRLLPDLTERLPRALARLLLAEVLAGGRGGQAALPVHMVEAGFLAKCRYQDLGKKGLRKLAELLTAHSLGELRPLEASAMLTRGGLALQDWSARTMGHRRIRGLYAAGEILDVDGRTGGYNMHAAFATAQLALRSIQEDLARTQNR